jgi:superfamily II DNA/RNA helicase
MATPEREVRMENTDSDLSKVEVDDKKKAKKEKKQKKKEKKEKKKRKRDPETSHPEEETATSTATAESKDEEDRKEKKKDPNLRKKNKRSTASSDNEQQNSSTNAQDSEKADVDVPAKRLKRSRPLAGKVIAVTTLAESSAASCPENFTNVMNLCKDAGAKPSNQVHKKTFCLVASESAVAGETQRVRKAWKKGIPVVDVAWVRKCVEDACLQPFGEFLVGADSSKRKTTKVGKGVTKPASKDRDTSVKDDPLREAGWSKSVDLGCCCSCHESGVTDCEWCVECSVNTATKA